MKHLSLTAVAKNGNYQGMILLYYLKNLIANPKKKTIRLGAAPDMSGAVLLLPVPLPPPIGIPGARIVKNRTALALEFRGRP